MGNAYFQYEIGVDKDDANAVDRSLVDGGLKRLVNKAFAYCKEARLSFR